VVATPAVAVVATTAVAVVATTAVAVVATTAVAVVATTAVAAVSGALVRVAGKIAATEVEPLQLVAVPSMRAVPVAAVVEPTTTVAMAVPKADLTFGSD
jgi:hypothetical protein